MRATNAYAPLRDEKKPKESIAESHMTYRSSFGDFGGSDKLKNTKSIFYIVLVFLGMGYVGITFVFSILAYQNTSSKTWNISQIVDNWKKIPIVSITATDEHHCALGYEPIIGKIWPGSVKGCYWGPDVKEEKLQNTLVKGECDHIQRRNRCENIHDRNPVIIRDFYPGKRICIQRGGQNIIDTHRPKLNSEGEAECPEKGDYVLCGPEGKVEYQLCVHAHNDWPITSVQYAQKGPKEGWVEVPLDDENSLFYSKNDPSGNLPIAEFALSEGNYLCIKQEDINRPDNKYIYPLLNDNFYKGCTTNVNGLTKDERWVLLFNKNTEYDIYISDENFKEAVNNLTTYQDVVDMKAAQYGLYYRTYITWENECEEDSGSEMKKLAENLNPINTLANAQLFFMVIWFLSLLILGITTPIFVMIRHCMILRGEKAESYRDVIISTGVRVINIIFIILKGAFLISCLVLIENYHEVYSKARKHNWTDLTTIYVLEYVDEYLDEAKKADWVSLTAVLVIAVCEISAIIVLWVLQRKSEKATHDARKSLLSSLAIQSKD